MAEILVVEDSRDSVVLIRRALGGHELHVAECLEEARAHLDSGRHFDLVLLDLNLPDGDGLGLAGQMSKDGQTELPIIFVSARQDVRDKLAAFALGAEDYIEKPFNLLELQARVTARLRRRESLAPSPAQTIEHGGLRLDLGSMRAYQCDGEAAEELDLSPTEHRILRTLFEHPDWLHTRDSIMAAIWGDKIVGPRTIDSHVSKLRGKIRQTRTTIESIRGLGYRLSIRD